MIGHGSPSATAFALARAGHAARAAARAAQSRIAFAATLILWLCLTAAAQEPHGDEPVKSDAGAEDVSPLDDRLRLRITWGGGEPTQWLGRIALDNGTLRDLRVAELNADAAGAVWLEDSQVKIASLSARRVEAIEISAHQAADSKLIIELSTAPAAAPLRAEVALADVLRNPVLLKLDDRGNTLKVETSPENALSILTDHEPLIFFPGEQFSFELRPALTEAVPGTTLDIQATLSPAGGKQTLWSDEPRLEVPIEGQPALSLNIPMPKAEGVYTVRVAASRPPGFGKRFLPVATTPLAERSFQVVVFDPHKALRTQRAEWKSVLEIDPANPRWWERLPSWTQLRRIPGLNPGPLGSIRAGAVDHPLGRFVQLPPTPPDSDAHWQAYSLPLEAIGVPHLLEIDFPSDEDQHFGVSIVEPNSSGMVDGIGRDAGVYVEGLGRSEAGGRATQRIVFWPRSQAPLLLVTNQHPTAAAHFGHIRVLKRTADQLAPAAPREPPGDRLVAAYIARPLVAEAFGVADKPVGSDAFSSAFDSSSGDWRTHYESATRLADYLRYAGYNSAVIHVLGGGGSLYAARRFSPGSLAGPARSSADRPAADGLELLLRVFDREQLALIPSLQFAAPLPELEEIRRGSDPQLSGLEWVGPDGRTWLQTYGAASGAAPYYNLLDPRVQQAVLAIVGELVDRYDHHPALAGVAIQLSSNGYAQLPPLDWGLDDATVSRFERDAGVPLGATGPNRFAARHVLLTGQYAESWRAWRAASLTRFYQQLAERLRRGNPRRHLLLTTEESFDHPLLAARIRPNILLENRVEATLLDIGIHREWLKGVPGVILCPTCYVEPMVPLRDRAIDLQINEAFAARKREAQPAGAALFYHRPQRQRLTSFAARSPFRFASEATLVSQPLAYGPAVRKPYALAMAENDFTILLDGGELLPFGQEDMLRETRKILQRLPAGAKVTEIQQQPIIVRSYSEPTGMTVLVINNCPWHTDAQITLKVPQAVAVEPLVPVQGDDQTSSLPFTIEPGMQPWTLSLEPYAVRAVRVAVEGIQIVSVEADVNDAAKEELEARIAELTERDTMPRIYQSLVNPSFEPVGGGGVLPGWHLSGNAAGATAELDATAPHDGRTCLYLQARDQPAVLESNSFPTPATGQFAMTVFLRSQDAAPTTELRIVIEADHPGRPYRRSVVIGGSQPAGYRPTAQWRPYPLLVNDLPLDSKTRMRIKFELLGPGEVWLDEIKTYDLLFPLSFYQHQRTEGLQLAKEIQAARSSHQEDRITDCVRVLEGYWPRFLAAYTPQMERAITNQPPLQPQKSLAPPADPKEKATPSFSERIKWLMPIRR